MVIIIISNFYDYIFFVKMMAMKKYPIIIAGMTLLSAIVLPFAQAQFPSLRTADTRTSLPETFMSARKSWGADLGFGGNFNRGNTDVDYMNGRFDLFKKMAPSTVYLDGAMVYNTFNGARVLNQGTLTARYDHAIQGPWKVFVFDTNAYNQFIGLNYRSTTGAGPWYDRVWGAVESGSSLAAVYEYENFTNGVYNRDGRVSFREVLRVPISEVADIRGDFFVIPRVDRIADYRLFGEIALESLIWKKNLGLKASWTEEYQSRPQPGIKPRDTIWLTSLTLHFGE